MTTTINTSTYVLEVTMRVQGCYGWQLYRRSDRFGIKTLVAQSTSDMTRAEAQTVGLGVLKVHERVR